MFKESITTTSSLIPPQPVPCGAREFTERVRGLLDGQPKDEATVVKAFDGLDEMFDLIAAGMYSIASMLVGEGEDSIRLVETAVANAEVSSAHDVLETRKNSRRALPPRNAASGRKGHRISRSGPLLLSFRGSLQG